MPRPLLAAGKKMLNNGSAESSNTCPFSRKKRRWLLTVVDLRAHSDRNGAGSDYYAVSILALWELGKSVTSNTQ